MATAPAPVDHPVSHCTGSAADRASTESGRSPISAHAPFLHNLSQRFRRGSNVSSNTSDSQSQNADKITEGGAGGGVAQNPKQQERARADASRAAKRYLMTIVRNDWQFSLATSAQQEKKAHPDSREPISWRLRDDGSEDELDWAHPTSPTKRRGKSDPYRFESPDAVADYVRERQVKRRKVLHKQMAWNEGLRHWVCERDAWTGAVWQNPTAPPAGQQSAEVPAESDTPLGIILRKGDIPDSENSTTRTNSANASNQDLNDTRIDFPAPDESHTPEVSASPAGTSADSLVHTTTATAATSTDPTSAAAAASETVGKKPAAPDDKAAAAVAFLEPPDPDAEGPYIPVYPPLFPEDNVLRSRISPATYGTIYSKIVVQSLTPNIPIPLPDMVRALVHGWKAEGQWPPTGNAAEAAAAARKGSRGSIGGAGAGGAFARWRKEKAARKGSSSAVGEGFVEGPEVVASAQPGHRVRRSISSVVKRVIGKEEEGARRESEVGLTVGFEEDDDETMAAAGNGDDEKLNRGLLLDDETARARGGAG